MEKDARKLFAQRGRAAAHAKQCDAVRDAGAACDQEAAGAFSVARLFHQVPQQVSVRRWSYVTVIKPVTWVKVLPTP